MRVWFFSEWCSLCSHTAALAFGEIHSALCFRVGWPTNLLPVNHLWSEWEGWPLLGPLSRLCLFPGCPPSLSVCLMMFRVKPGRLENQRRSTPHRGEIKKKKKVPNLKRRACSESENEKAAVLHSDQTVPAGRGENEIGKRAEQRGGWWLL